MSNPQLHRYVGSRPRHRNEVDCSLYRWPLVVSLHMSGYNTEEVSELTGYAPGTILRILKDPRAQAMKQQILSDLDEELEAKKKEVYEVVSNALQGVPISDDRKWAVDLWMKVHGKYKTNDKGGTTNVTAENVVMQIMQNGVPKSE
jgi:hypothetical protein